MIKKIFLVVFVLATISSVAQKSNVSAYSFFGIGDEGASKSVEQASMGGVNVSFSDYNHLTFSNPAGLASLRFTNYAFAVKNQNMSVENATDRQSASVSNISYLAVGIPFGKLGGMAFGLIPNSSVGYSLQSNVLDSEGTITEATLFSGEGGTSKVFLGAGFNVFKGLKLGIQGAYVFGRTEKSVVNQLLGVSRATKYEVISNVSGASFKIGAQYKTTLNDKMYISGGVVLELKNELESKGDEYLYSVVLSSSEIAKDTILPKAGESSRIKTLFKKPLKSIIGVGVGENNKWFVGVDYSFRDKVSLTGEVEEFNSKLKYTNSSNVAVGGFYIPKFNSISSYWERVTYRAGLKLENNGLMFRSTESDSSYTEIKDFGMSFGVGLPIGNQLSDINIGFELGKRGSTSGDLIKENYFNFNLSLSLSDKWFKKREIF